MNAVDKAVTAALAAGRRAQLATDIGVMRRALAVANLVKVCGTQSKAAELLGIKQPTVSDLVRRVIFAPDLDGFDVIEVSADNTNYEPIRAGRLAVQHDEELVDFADDLDEALMVIAAKTGTDVELVRDTNYFSGRRWVVRV